MLIFDSVGGVLSIGSHSRTFLSLGFSVEKKVLFTENVTCLDDMGIGVIKINDFTIWPYLVSNLHVYARVYLILLFYAPKSYKEYRLKLVIDKSFC